MQFHKIFSAAALISLTAACSFNNSLSEINALNEANPTGSAFSATLAEEYRVFSNFQLEQEEDFTDAIHFARKGLAAANGVNAMPEPISDWDLSQRQILELYDGRARLIAAYDAGAIEYFPKLSAVTQSRFDCWIEAEEEIHLAQGAYTIPCKSQFFEALAQLEANVAQITPKEEPEPAPIMPIAQAPEPIFPEPIEPVMDFSDEPLAVQDAIYLIFFDFDKSSIGNGGMNVIQTVADEINNRVLNSVVITGHADSSGPQDYNRRLGERRAQAAKKALVENGVPANLIRIQTRGENELLVPTSDGVKEPANRRVTITFE